MPPLMRSRRAVAAAAACARMSRRVRRTTPTTLRIKGPAGKSSLVLIACNHTRITCNHTAYPMQSHKSTPKLLAPGQIIRESVGHKSMERVRQARFPVCLRL